MTAKIPKRAGSATGSRSTIYGVGGTSVDSSGADVAITESSGGESTAPAESPGSLIDEQTEQPSMDPQATQSASSFGFRMPPMDEEAGSARPRDAVPPETRSGQTAAAHGKLPAWMSSSAKSLHLRKSGTFMMGSPARSADSQPLSPGSVGAASRQTVAHGSAVFARRSGAEDSAAPPSVVLKPGAQVPESALPSTDSGEGETTRGRRTRLTREAASDRGEGVSRSSLTPGAWAVRVLGVVSVGALLGGIASLPVGSPTLAPGVLTSAMGAQTISAGSEGTVTEVLVSEGQPVAAGQALVRLQSVRLDVHAARDRRQWTTLREQVAADRVDTGQMVQQRQALLDERRRLLARRRTYKEDELVNRRRRVREVQQRFDEQMASSVQLGEAKAELEAAIEQRLAIDSELAELKLQQAEVAHAAKRSERHELRELSNAEAAAKEAVRLLGLSVVKAPFAGWVEGLSVAKGSSAQSGTPIARVLPKASPTRIVAFVPASEASSVRVGTDGTAQFESLAVGNAQPVGARVVGVSREVALPASVEALLGAVPAVPMVRVELELLDEPEYYRIQPHLRSGSPAVVTVQNTDLRLVDLVIREVGQWFR